jgi:hypothetical protein
MNTKDRLKLFAIVFGTSQLVALVGLWIFDEYYFVSTAISSAVVMALAIKSPKKTQHSSQPKESSPTHP